jgi:hypothetical protein
VLRACLKIIHVNRFHAKISCRMASFSILAVLASATHFTRRVCSVSACHRDLAAVRLLYARPLRSLLQPSRRSEVLELARDRPLTSLHAALSSRLPAGVAVPADVFLARGRRRIESDAELAEVLAAAVAHGVDPHLRVQTSDELGSAVAAAAQAAEQAAALASAEAATADAAELSAGPKQLLSFFLFSKIAAGRLPLLQLQLHQALSRLGARGSVYVAGEGLNAQLALPATRLLELRLALGRIPELAQIDLNLGVQVGGEEDEAISGTAHSLRHRGDTRRCRQPGLGREHTHPSTLTHLIPSHHRTHKQSQLCNTHHTKHTTPT